MNCVQTFAFLIGFTIGFFLIFTVYTNEEHSYNLKRNRPGKQLTHETLYKLWFDSNGFKSTYIAADEISFSSNTFQLENAFLFDKVKVTCVVFVTSTNNAYAVKHSWGKKCNTLRFYSKESVPYLKTKRVHKQKSSWHQLCDIMGEIWNKQKVDWILFAPDYVFVIPENLRYLVAYRDPERSYYLGHTSRFWNQLYNSGETAYVLSKGAIKKLVNKFNSSDECSRGGKYTNNEDYLLGKHLSQMGVKPEDTRDEAGRSRFHLFTPSQLMVPGYREVLEKHSKRSVYPFVQGRDCCSPSSVSFKGTQNDWIFYYSYLLYNVKLFTSGNLGNNLSRIRSTSFEAAESFVRSVLGMGANLSSITNEQYYQLWELKINTPEQFNEKIRQENIVGKYDFLRNISRISNFNDNS